MAPTLIGRMEKVRFAFPKQTFLSGRSPHLADTVEKVDALARPRTPPSSLLDRHGAASATT
jgi:hypothetical protein